MASLTSRLVPALVSLFLLALLLYFVGWDRVALSLKRADLPSLLFALLSLCLFHFVMAFRLSQLASLPLLRALRVHCSAMLLSELTPGRVGYLAAVAGLRYGEGLKGSKAIAVVSAPFLVDGLLKVLLAIAAFVYFFGFVESLAFLGVGASLAFISALYLLFHPALPALLSHLPMPKAFKERLLRHVEDLHREKALLTFLPFVVATALAGWIAKGLMWYALFSALHLPLSLLDALLLQPLATMLDFLPFTLAGSGATEAGGVLLLSFLGVDGGRAAAFFLLRRLLNLLPLLPFAALLPQWRPRAGGVGGGVKA